MSDFDITITKTSAEDDAALAKASKNTYLPRVQIMAATSGLVSEGKAPVGVWALVEDKEPTNLTKSFEGLILARRMKGVWKVDNKFAAVYTTQHPDFEKIQAKSEIKNSGAFWGIEYLIWVKDLNVFASLHCSSPTARRASKAASAILAAFQADNKKVPYTRFESKLIDNGTNKWHGPVFHAVSTPFSKMPDVEATKAQITKFLNPPAAAEVTPDGEAARPD